MNDLSNRSATTPFVPLLLVMLGLLGVLINHGLQIAENRLLRWRPQRS
jgi:ABC-type nitrate/sulfonate/bicarbonate transport system permease component